MQENTDQKNSEYGQFSQSDGVFSEAGMHHIFLRLSL